MKTATQAEMALGEGDASRISIDAPSEAWPSNLAELVDVLRTLFLKRGRDEHQAIADAQHAAQAIGEYLGGRNFYLPHGDRLRTWLRDRALYLEYNGRNKAELARRYKVTERRIEQIAAEQRAVYIRRIQPDMFGTTKGDKA
jgi:Mor family transcriptional regulator